MKELRKNTQLQLHSKIRMEVTAKDRANALKDNISVFQWRAKSPAARLTHRMAYVI